MHKPGTCPQTSWFPFVSIFPETLIKTMGESSLRLVIVVLRFFATLSEVGWYEHQFLSWDEHCSKTSCPYFLVVPGLHASSLPWQHELPTKFAKATVWKPGLLVILPLIIKRLKSLSTPFSGTRAKFLFSPKLFLIVIRLLGFEAEEKSCYSSSRAGKFEVIINPW